MTSWPVNIAPIADTPIACGTVVFRHRGELRVTAIVKATLRLVPGGTASFEPPADLLLKDRHLNRSPTGSVQAASDLAPYRPRVDVTLTGHAYALPRPAPVAAARLAVFRDQALIDKTVHVYGERTQPGGNIVPTPGAVRPFDRMPLVYERAFAALDDPSSVENPVGVPEPNLIDARDPRRPVGFGPISRHWPIRRRRLAAVDRAAFEAAIAQIPDAFDWGYFQDAPPDQQLDALRGDEWIVLDGMHPTLPRVASRLPSAVAVARVYGGAGLPGAAGEPFRLVADTLAIDVAGPVCDVVWRGSIAVPGGEPRLSSLRILVGLELAGQPVAWPALPAPAVLDVPRDPRPEVPRSRRPDSTAAPDMDAGSARAATPFEKQGAATGGSPYRKASLPPARAPNLPAGTLADEDLPTLAIEAPVQAPDALLGRAGGRPFESETIALQDEPPARPARPATPFVAAPLESPPEETIALLEDLGPAARPATPFDGIAPLSPFASPYGRETGPLLRTEEDLTGTVVTFDDVPAHPPVMPFAGRSAPAAVAAPSASSGGLSSEVSLRQYAAVNAAVAEGFPLDDVLAVEGLAPGSWPGADLDWTQRLVDDAGGTGELFAGYRRELAAAEDRLARKVTPLDDDVQGWVSLVRAMSAASASPDLLGRLGLGPNDLARLQRRWSRRLEADGELRRKAGELMKRAPAELPRVVADRAKLRGSRTSPSR